MLKNQNLYWQEGIVRNASEMIMDNLKQFQENFFDNLNESGGFLELFDHLPDVCFFVKNSEGRIIKWNRANMRQFGVKDEREVVGKTDYDLFPRELADRYTKDDREIIGSQKKVINRIELATNEDGTVSWFSTNKLPLYSREGSIIGVAGTMRSLKKIKQYLSSHRELESVLLYINSNYTRKIRVQELADQVSLSVSQLEKKFKKCFHQSPNQFIIGVRVKEACRLLIQSQKTLAQIAKETGFYDRSAFSKQFYRHMGMLPKDYRKQY